MGPSAAVPGYRLAGVGGSQPRRAPAQFTEQKYNHLIQQPTGPRPEEVPGVPGSSLFLAHTYQKNRYFVSFFGTYFMYEQLRIYFYEAKCIN